MSSNESSELMQQFALLTVSSFKYKPTSEGTNLVLALNDQRASVRKHGVNMLLKTIQSEVQPSIHMTAFPLTLAAEAYSLGVENFFTAPNDLNIACVISHRL